MRTVWATRLICVMAAALLAVALVAIALLPRPGWLAVTLIGAALLVSAAAVVLLGRLRRRRSWAERKRRRLDVRRRRQAGRRAARLEGRLRELQRELVDVRASLAAESQARHETVDALQAARRRQLEREERRAARHLDDLAHGRPLQPLDPPTSADLVGHLVDTGQGLYTRPLLDDAATRSETTSPDLRAAYRSLHALGYYDTALRIATTLVERSDDPRDQARLAQTRYQYDVHHWRPEDRPGASDPGAGAAFDPQGPVLHFVGKALPHTQTGYTLRTQYLTEAQHRAGLRPVVAVQVAGERRDVPERELDVIDGVPIHRLAGPRRGSIPWPEWVELNVAGLVELIGEVRPSVIHAHSDFVQPMIATQAAHRCGVPIVYETRGFWEETWLSRMIDTYPDLDLPALFAAIGEPDAYVERQRQESRARKGADRVITLAEVMQDHIQTIDGPGTLRPALLPNAVDVDQFRPLDAAARRAALGIAEDEHVIGYVSSIVEYEGIDILVHAVAQVRDADAGGRRPRLLVVGDGTSLPGLRDLAARLKLDDAVFTGRVSHDEIQSYYAAIDTFVIPRRPTSVTRLVTPLKPFEAMAMGKRLVVSDVEALREIVDAAGTGRTFTAGCAASLTRVLIDEIRVPRAELIDERAREWVTAVRTWDADARTARGLYEQIRRDHLERRAGAVASRFGTADPPAVSGVRPALSWHSLGTPQPVAKVLGEGWRSGGGDIVPIRTFNEWHSLNEGNRTLAWQLHAWIYLDSFLCDYDTDSDEETLVVAAELALRWIEAHPTVDHDDMAWYDMALAIRSARLLRLAQRLRVAGILPETQKALTLELGRHGEELALDRAFASHNNHGFYTAAAQVEMAVDLGGRGERRAWEEQGRRRMSEMVSAQFLPDGAHAEHSPGYHVMLLQSFNHAATDGLIDDDHGVAERLDAARELAAWMRQPDDTMVQLGDTNARFGEGTRDVSDLTSEFAVHGLKTYPDGGYGFVREDAHRFGGSYLAFQTGFHSRAHKHADDLTFTWFDRGRPIVVDSGKYGYGPLLPADSELRKLGFFYASAERQYVESTPAHNTVSVDGADHDRRRPAYGSGLEECTVDDGRYRLSGRAPHQTFRHHRLLEFQPGRHLVVTDTVEFTDDDEHSVVAWLNLPGDLEVRVDGSTVVVDHADLGSPLLITSDGAEPDVVRGQHMPLRGWRSVRDGAFERCWSVALRTTARNRVLISTTLAFDEDPA